MRVLKYLILLLPITACRHDKGKVTIVKSDTTPIKVQASQKNLLFKPYKIAGDFLVTDTGYFDDAANAATFEVVQKNGKLVDTIEKGFGMQKVNDNTFLYWTITDTGPLPKDISPNKHYKNNISGSFGKYILINGDRKQELAIITIDFDNFFSSPNVIDGKIYYWQIKQQKSAELSKISAAEYDPGNHLTKSHYLFDDDMGTDDAGYFPNPYQKNDTIYFDAGKDKLMKFSKAFQSYN